MNLNRSTAAALRIGIIIGMALTAAGLAASTAGYGDSLLGAGILVLILSPLAGVVVSFAALVSEKDLFWAAIAGILLAITAAGMAIAMLRRRKRILRPVFPIRKSSPISAAMPNDFILS